MPLHRAHSGRGRSGDRRHLLTARSAANPSLTPASHAHSAPPRILAGSREPGCGPRPARRHVFPGLLRSSEDRTGTHRLALFLPSWVTSLANTNRKEGEVEMATATKDMKPAKALPVPNADFFGFAADLPAEEMAVV